MSNIMIAKIAGWRSWAWGIDTLTSDVAPRVKHYRPDYLFGSDEVQASGI